MFIPDSRVSAKWMIKISLFFVAFLKKTKFKIICMYQTKIETIDPLCHAQAAGARAPLFIFIRSITSISIKQSAVVRRTMIELSAFRVIPE